MHRYEHQLFLVSGTRTVGSEQTLSGKAWRRGSGSGVEAGCFAAVLVGKDSTVRYRRTDL
ncbi:MAG: hypothetical protein AVDCRST_MAG14-401 [uncultured Rubrobacteraceae bacterium]|uniref:Uncharacterized protein n=1 Tax=uncultured Rubrobacteraceae bacterium TaxID=349277 RepID=A0A6J4QLW5_9ACTN|nr:MAG: hypothetical protein AVDCRST_MAG14-401 [uncultured Rubrobacteraceae bacterium]